MEDIWEDEEWGIEKDEPDESDEPEQKEYIEKEDENIFGNEYNVFERTNSYVDYDKNSKKTQDPVERLKININAISMDLMKYDNNITYEDIEIMTYNVNKLNKPEYKNATAYVLGYLATRKNSRKLNKKIIYEVFDKCLPNIQDSSVKKPDVIRYARLWLNL